MPDPERYGEKIVIVDYDPTWPAMFESERSRVYGALGEMVTTIEHVGSTAVPGLAAKPIIDLLVEVRSLDEARARGLKPLERLGYVHISEYESWLPGEMLCRKAVFGPWTHHLHLMEPTSPRWDELIIIRDYLRRHADVAQAYADLKRAAALVFEDDIAGFRDAKRPFLRMVMQRAWREKGEATRC